MYTKDLFGYPPLCNVRFRSGRSYGLYLRSGRNLALQTPQSSRMGEVLNGS
jgi:hypothetical protein